MSEEYKYTGEELVLFSQVKHWKKYFSRKIRPYIKGTVLEVGAGIGSNTAFLNDGSVPAWLMLEPDSQMAANLDRAIQDKQYPSNCHSKKGMIADIDEQFDTIIYIDVLEHIESDAAEVSKAADHLNPGGHIIILAPAFKWLYSPFDKTIGHYRRYNRKMLRKIKPGTLECTSSRYYDSAGYFASVMNKVFLKQKYPSPRQTMFWDRWLVPFSRITDKIVFHSFGKSIITVWQKKN